MGAIVIMLIVALVPTGLAGYTLGNGDAAICSFKYKDYTDREDAAFVNMVLSIVFLTIGLLVRIFKLSRTASVSATTNLRSPFSKAIIRYLGCVHVWSNTPRSPNGLRRVLIYRPLLAFFLLFRVAIDFYLSMLGEISSRTLPFHAFLLM